MTRAPRAVAAEASTRSKTFIAFMLIQLCWTGLLVLLATICAVPAAQTGYLGLQARHDKSVRMAPGAVSPEAVTDPGVRT